MTTALIDTHILLWAADEPERLGRQRDFVEDSDHDLLLSAVVSWEIAIKYALGRLALPDAPVHFVPRVASDLGASVLVITQEATLGVAELELVHKDPFDRLLISQALVLDVPIVTADPVFARYPVRVLSP